MVIFSKIKKNVIILFTIFIRQFIVKKSNFNNTKCSFINTFNYILVFFRIIQIN